MIRKLCEYHYISHVTHGLGLCRLVLTYCTCFFASFHRFYGAKRNCLQGKSPSADNNCTLHTAYPITWLSSVELLWVDPSRKNGQKLVNA